MNHRHKFAPARGLMRLAPLVGAVAILIVNLTVLAQPATTAPATTAPARGEAGAKVDAPAPPKPSLFDMFRKGGIFMYPLAACSVVALAIIFERMLALRRANVIPTRFAQGLRATMRDLRRDRQAGLVYCRNHDVPIARMIAAGLKRLPRGLDALEKAIEDAGTHESMLLRRNMRFLYALGSVATLLGLIGTISGMIQAFQVAAAGGVGRVEQLSTGIYEAMVCTFGGLAVAIVVTLAYYFFVGRIERLVGELNVTLMKFSETYGIDAGEPPADERPKPRDKVGADAGE